MEAGDKRVLGVFVSVCLEEGDVAHGGGVEGVTVGSVIDGGGGGAEVVGEGGDGVVLGGGRGEAADADEVCVGVYEVCEGEVLGVGGGVVVLDVLGEGDGVAAVLVEENAGVLEVCGEAGGAL